ncbi:hypothetical protein CHARACLAT_001983 [Characodon lateralis]|uniref:Uncharacterized protein n=1 Tax=Characodon lateralis TaxID=208331 RepID=A0ABU7CW93_9TELE|nr:hypothetical protein [Characodon lateralis]
MLCETEIRTEACWNFSPLQSHLNHWLFHRKSQRGLIKLTVSVCVIALYMRVCSCFISVTNKHTAMNRLNHLSFLKMVILPALSQSILQMACQALPCGTQVWPSEQDVDD